MQIADREMRSDLAHLGSSHQLTRVLAKLVEPRTPVRAGHGQARKSAANEGETVMIVRELMELLSHAAPHATVMLLDDYEECNAQAIKSLQDSSSSWTIETGLCNGHRYERLYTGEPLPELPNNSFEEVKRRKVAVLFLVA